MSNIRGITILFDGSLDEEYVENLEKAIYMFKGIRRIERDVDNPEKWISESKIRTELIDKLFEVLYKK